MVNISQIMTIDRTLLTRRVRGLPATVVRKVEDGLRMVLAL